MIKIKTKNLDIFKNRPRMNFTIHEGNIVIKNLGKFTTVPQIVLDISNGDIKGLESALKNGLDINKKIKTVCKTPIDLAMITEQFDSVRWLVSKGADLNTEDSPSFLTAVSYCNEEVIRYLAENGANIHAVKNFGRDAFDQALSHQRYDNFHIINELGHTVKEYGGYAFRMAVLSNQKEAVGFFIDNGVDINYHLSNIVFEYNETPLCVAVENANLDMVKYLMEHGADVTFPDKRGMRPYNYAMEQGNYKMAEYIKSFEPAELHNLQNKLQDLETYKLPEALLTFLQGDNLRMELGKDYTFEHIEFFSLVDTIEMKIGRRKLLRISKETGDYPDLIIVWNPKAQCVAYYDTEHEEFGNIAPFEEFMQNAGEYMERVLNGEYEI